MDKYAVQIHQAHEASFSSKNLSEYQCMPVLSC